MTRHLKLLFLPIISALLLFSFFACSAPQTPPDTSDGGGNHTGEQTDESSKLTFELSEDGSYYIVTGTSLYTEGVITRPSEFGGLPVKEIKERAFYLNCSPSDIIIPDSITRVGKDALRYCTKTHAAEDGVHYVGNWAVHFDNSSTAIKIREGTVGIADYAFTNLTDIVKLTLPDSGLKYIGASSFSYCTSLREVVIPNSTVHLGENAFGHCSKLMHMVYGDGLTEIGKQEFSFMNLLSVTIGAGVQSIDPSVFEYSSSLLEVVNNSSIPTESLGISYLAPMLINRQGESLILKVDDYLFLPHDGSLYLIGYVGTSSVLRLPELDDGESYVIYSEVLYHDDTVTDVVIPSSVSAIGDYAFSYCDNLVNVVINEGVTNIGFGVLSHCSALTELEIPEGVTVIEPFAFSSNPSLERVSLPESLEKIKNSAFSECPRATETENNLVYIDKWLIGTSNNSITEIVGVRADTVGIADCAFKACSKIESAVFPASVRYFGDIILYDSINTLKRLTTPYAGVKAIDIRKLEYLALVDGEQIICYDFLSSDTIKELVLPATVKVIDYTSFLLYTALESIYFEGTSEDYGKIEEYFIPEGTSVYIYSEDEPTAEGNYWHYDENGNPVKWDTAPLS